MSEDTRPRRRDQLRGLLHLQRSSRTVGAIDQQGQAQARPSSTGPPPSQPGSSVAAAAVAQTDGLTAGQSNSSQPISNDTAAPANATTLTATISTAAPPLPSQSSSVAAPDASQAPAQPSDGHNLLQNALLKLTTSERQVIEQYLSAQDVGAAVDEVHGAALKQKQVCERKMWRWTVRGKEIVLRDQADKVLRWLDRFKAVGDVAANADPIHIGLPWAGIRILLEARPNSPAFATPQANLRQMTVSESHQMAALLFGMSQTLYMTARLKAYFEYRQRLPTDIATEHLEKMLVETYAHVLKFLAAAIQTFQQPTLSRTWHALWEASALDEFETLCDKHVNRIELEVSNCDRQLTARHQKDAVDWRRSLTETLQKLEEIQQVGRAVHALREKIDIAGLMTVPGAIYNSHEDEHMARCLPGTRTDLLQQIAEWAQDPDGCRIFWLVGMAGTGKSTISRTVAGTLDERKRLGASFFFKRGEGDRGIAKRFFPTVILQLLDIIPGLTQHVVQALDADSLLCERNLQQQFEKLLEDPLKSFLSQQGRPQVFVIVIDALDECERKEDVLMILKLLPRLEAISSICVKIFVTSRPELPIEIGFQRMNGDLHKDVKLEEVQESTIEADIRLFFRHMFTELREKRSLQRRSDSLPADWPGAAAIEALVKIAVPLFIFASTIYRFVSESTPQRRLAAILQQQGNRTYSGLAKTYLPILEQLLAERDESSHEQIVADFRDVVGPIVLVAEPLSVQSLTNLLQIDLDVIEDCLDGLHSVLRIPHDTHQPIHLLHLSFRDFLVDPVRKDRDRFWINEVQTHNKLADRCLRLLSRPNVLRRDICNVTKPGTRRADVGLERIAQCISPEVAYACRYWVWHIQQGGGGLHDNGQVHQYLNSHLIHWLEALTWLGQLPSAVILVSELRLCTRDDESTQLVELLDDAQRFLRRNWRMIDEAPLQLYYSALPFTPTQSVIRRLFEQYACQSFKTFPSPPLAWTGDLQTLEGHEFNVTAMSFSWDGQTVASASSDGSVRLWNVRTGEEKQRIFTDLQVTKIVFSKDGLTLGLMASDRPNFAVEIWNTRTGELLQHLGHVFGHRGNLDPLAEVSPNGRYIANATRRRVVELLDARSGKLLHLLHAHFGTVTALAFSPGSETVATGTADGYVRLWSVDSGAHTNTAREHELRIHALAFCPSTGLTVASASEDRTVRLWEVSTGKHIRVLNCHEGPAHSVAFTMDGQVILSSSIDLTVKACNALTGEELFQISSHETPSLGLAPKFAVSPAKQMMAVAVSEGVIQIHETQAGKLIRTLTGHTGYVTTVVFSPTGSLLASSSIDGTVRLWSISTGEIKAVFHIGICGALAFSPDEKMLSSAPREDGTLKLWSIETHECIQTLRGHSEGIFAAHFTADGHAVFTVSLDCTVGLWDTRTGDSIHELSLYRDVMKTLDLSPDARYAVTGSLRGTIETWDLSSGNRIQSIHDDGPMPIAMEFSPDGLHIATVSNDATLWLWNVSTREKIWHTEITTDQEEKSHYKRKVNGISFSRDGSLIALMIDESTIQIRLCRTGEFVRLLEYSASPRVALKHPVAGFRSCFPAPSPIGLVTWPHDNTFLAMPFTWTSELLNTATGELLSLTPDGYKAHSIALSPDGQVFAASYNTGSIRLWDANRLWGGHNERVSYRPASSPFLVFDVLFSPDGQIVATTTARGFKLWNTSTGNEMETFEVPHAGRYGFTFSPDGLVLAWTLIGPHTYELWSIKPGKHVKTLYRPKPLFLRLDWVDRRDPVVALARNGAAMALTEPGVRMLWLWHAQVGELTLNIDPELKRPRLAFSPDGHAIVCASDSDASPDQCDIYLWDLRSAASHQRITFEQKATLITVNFSPDGAFVLTTSVEGIILLDSRTGARVQELKWFQNSPRHLEPTSVKAYIWKKTHDIQFSADGTHVETSFGAFTLKWKDTSPPLELLERVGPIRLRRNWIQCRGEAVLHVPYEYHEREVAWDAYEDTVAICPRESENPVFFKTYLGP